MAKRKALTGSAVKGLKVVRRMSEYAGSRATAGHDRMKDVTLYQPADWNGINIGGNYDLSNDVNDTAYLNSVSRPLNFSAANFTPTSSALCHSFNINAFTVNRVFAFTMLTRYIL